MNSNAEAPASSVAGHYGHDHTRLDDLLQQFERLNGTDLATARPIFAEFKAGLERHIGWEEEILFPIFEDRTGMRDSGPTAVMRWEHNQIKNYLEQIQVALVQQWPASIMDVLALEDLLMQHNHKEENILYPAVDSMLDTEKRAKVFAAMEKYPDGHSTPARA